jgi:hypothetical protein
MQRDIKKCCKELQDKWKTGKEECRKIGIEIALSCTSRTPLEQVALYLRGRFATVLINPLYTLIMRTDLPNDSNHIVTWTLESKHVIYPNKRPLSEAFDFYIVKNGKAIWDVKADVNKDELPDYKQVADIFEKLGLRSGIHFGDPCHVEIKG